MRILIVCVGKLKESFWVQACAEYLKRLKPYARIEVCELADVNPAQAGGEAAACVKEGEGILARVPEGAHCFLLAIEGRQRSSEGLAAEIDELALEGRSTLAFVVGGSCGVSDAVKARADDLLSFGKITLPHNLARVVLLEQLYRCFKISRNEPYHK